MKVRLSLLLLLTLTPALAFARPKTATAHMRPQLFHDRTQKVRTHEVPLHQTHTTPSKIQQPPPPQKDDQS